MPRNRFAKTISTAILLALLLAMLVPPVRALSAGQFSPPHSDRGIDTDDDLLFNVLHLDLNVESTSPGTFFLVAELWDGTNTTLITGDFATFFLDGADTIPLDLSGLDIRTSGIDGPYQANLYLYNDAFMLDDFNAHTTLAYRSTDFDSIPASFAPPHSDMGIDRDSPPDGEYNVLQLDVRINVTDAGVFAIGADLLDSSGSAFVASDGWLGSLPSGLHSIPLLFPGVAIRSSGFNGPYYVNITLFSFQPGGGYPSPIDGQAHLTQPYAVTDFQSSTPADLTGSVRDAGTTGGLPNALVEAFNYLDSYVSFGFADGFGNYSLPLYAGDWVVVYDDPTHQAELVRVSLSGSTVQNADLGPQQSTTISTDLTFPSWDSAELGVRSVVATDSPLFRLLFDWEFGNQDQVLDLEEFEAILSALGFLPLAVPENSQDTFLVDGTPFDGVPGSGAYALVNITGSIDDATPPELAFNSSFVSNTTISSPLMHTVDLRVDYDQSYPFTVVNAYVVRLPSTSVLTNFTASPLVTVTGIGTDTVTVDPALDPNPFDSVYFEWISLETESPDTTAPAISGSGATPNPAEAGQPVLFAATVTDNGALGPVSVDVSAPGGASLGNFTMTFNSATGKYEVSQSFSLVGTLSFTIWASDEAGNTASTSGSVVVRDTTAPVANAGPDQTVPAGTTVTLDGSGSSDLDIASYSWSFTDGGTKTLTGAKPTYRFDNASTYTITLTVEDASGNSATDTVLVTVSATTGTIEGTVTDPGGQPVTGATVRLLSGTTEVATTTTDTSGHFTFSGVAPGSYTLRVEGSGYEVKTDSVAVTAGQTATKSLQLTAVPATTPSGFGSEPISLLIILVVILAVTIAGSILMMRRRREPGA